MRVQNRIYRLVTQAGVIAHVPTGELARHVYREDNARADALANEHEDSFHMSDSTAHMEGARWVRPRWDGSCNGDNSACGGLMSAIRRQLTPTIGPTLCQRAMRSPLGRRPCLLSSLVYKSKKQKTVIRKRETDRQHHNKKTKTRTDKIDKEKTKNKLLHHLAKL